MVKPERNRRERARSLRARLVREQRGRCYWCNRSIREIKTYGGRIPDGAATLDHLIPRLSPVRLTRPARGEQRYVAACQKCNHERGKHDCVQTFLHEQRRRSARG